MEDDGDGAKLHVQDAVAEAGVEGDEEADGGEQELDGADEELAREGDDADVPLLEARVERPVARLDAQAPRLVDEELGRVGLVDEDEGDEEDDGLQDAGEVFGPAPAEGGLSDDGGGDDGAWGGGGLVLARMEGVERGRDSPNDGPPTTAIAYPAIAIPLSSGPNKSPSTPPVLVTGALAKKAPKNLVSISV